uniref:Rab-GAP TBC domain-containing protein n=1 Tax=Strix occidentalis caurina TaxID=311401 RepID=A0A8D0FVW3_STROC
MQVLSSSIKLEMPSVPAWVEEVIGWGVCSDGWWLAAANHGANLFCHQQDQLTLHTFPSPQMCRRVYKGIPLQVRGQVWSLLLDVEKMKKENEGKYEQMKEQAKSFSSEIKQIDLDVNRTFRNHIMFRDRYGVNAGGCAWGELDGVATSPLAWGDHQPPGSKQLTGEQSHLCSTNHQQMVWPTDVGLLILSLDRSTH